MPIDLYLPSHAVIPLGIGLAHIVFLLYVAMLRTLTGQVSTRFFIIYLLVTALWNFNLVAIIDNTLILPNFNWELLWPYGLILIGLLYWAFSRAFLRLSWRVWWGWSIALAGIVLLSGLNIGWLMLPLEAPDNGQIIAANSSFIIAISLWAILMVVTLFMAVRQLAHTKNPAHRNRIQYLVLSVLILSLGYGLYFTTQEPLWTTGLIITWLGNSLATYLVAVENLIDLSTGVRLTLRTIVVILVTLAVYIAGIYLVQIFLGDYLASTFLANLLSLDLLVAAVTAVLLTIVYLPIRRITESIMGYLLFGRSYDYPAIISEYAQTISNILDLDELTEVSINYITQLLGLEHGTLFLLDTQNPQQIHFRTLPLTDPAKYPETLTLSKNTPITRRLINEGKPLAQYNIDISPQFSSVPEPDVNLLKSFHFEWYIPILKKEVLIGFFGLGSKISRQAYDARDIRLLVTLADQTALALENANLVDQLQRTLDETNQVKNLMDNVFDSMNNGVVTINMGGEITFINSAAERIFDLPPGGYYLGMSYPKVMNGLTKTIFRNLLSNVLERQDQYTNYEITADLPRRGRVDLKMSLAPLLDIEGIMQGVTIVMDDQTETKRLQAVRDMFRRYLSPAVVDRLPTDPTKLQLGGHRQDVTILFADIRGFTTFGEDLTPEQLVDTLNDYLSMAARSILTYEGTLDKFIGDAVMGIFNAPLEQKDHVLRAVRAAAAMRQAIIDYHNNIGQDRHLSFGIGLHVGEAVVGNIGMTDRMDYTAIGDTVNVAKRIQENTPGGKILMTEAVYSLVKEQIEAVFYEEMQLKGRRRPVKTYELQSATIPSFS